MVAATPLLLFAQKITQEEVQRDLEAGVVSFVHAVRAETKAHMASYDDFRNHLIGKRNIPSMPAEGEALLEVTYKLIQENASDDIIVQDGFKPFTAAAKLVLEYEKNSGGGKTDGKLNNGSVHLFGGNDADLAKAASYGGRVAAPAAGGCKDTKDCKWYQFGCHMHNVGVWLCENKDTLAGIYYVIGIVSIIFFK
jgi:hypothetical protein